MERHILQKFFKPQAVAVVGASPKEGSIGYTLVDNLKRDGFQGQIYPINPKHEEILGLKAYPSITRWVRPSIWPSSPSPSWACRQS